MHGLASMELTASAHEADELPSASAQCCMQARMPPCLLHTPPLRQLGELHQTEQWLKTKKLSELSAEDMRQVKSRGFSDTQIARCLGTDMMAGELGGWVSGPGGSLPKL